MKPGLSSQELQSVIVGSASESNRIDAWFKALACISLLLISTLLLFNSTVTSITRFWWHSETFAHCSFVIPVFAWLVWRKRPELLSVVPKPAWSIALVVALLGAVWLIAVVTGIQVLEQLSFVMMCIALIWAVIGHQAARLILFPLAFLLFAAPVGEELMPQLMEFTADVTVRAIQLLGIPVYREGLFFSLPTGNWSVVEACSGIRYLIASLMLGSLYAYLTFSDYRKWAVFLLLSIAVPIIANGFRAVIIVVLGHHSGMKIATGVDHLVYGWLFFGVVMFLLFSLGYLLKGKDELPSIDADASDVFDSGSTVENPTIAWAIRSSAILWAVLIVPVAVWPLYASAIERNAVEIALLAAPLEAMQVPGWALDESPSPADGWMPEYNTYDESLATRYVNAEGQVVNVIRYAYHRQYQGKELISSSNKLVHSNDEIWRIAQRQPGYQEFANHPMDYESALLRSREQDLLVWRWNRIAGVNTFDSARGKLIEARNKLLLQPQSSIGVIVFTDASSEGASMLLSDFSQQFLDAWAPQP